jgi:hypothetical protein
MAQRLRLRDRLLELVFFRLLLPRRLVLPPRLVRPVLDRLPPLRLRADFARDADRDEPDRADFARDAEDRPPFAADFLAEPPRRDLAATLLRPELLLSPPHRSDPSSLCRARRFCFAV